LAPNIIGQPANQAVSQGQSASFTVSVTGIPDPTYQWLKDGSPITSATNATLGITQRGACQCRQLHGGREQWLR
jgi:hypothetical protein